MNKLQLGGILVVLSQLALGLPSLAIAELDNSAEVAVNTVNNTDVSGALLKSGKFKIIAVPKNFNWESAALTAASQFESNLSTSLESNALTSSSNLPALQDGISYVLAGKILAADDNISSYHIENTDKNSLTRSFSVTVSYKLVRVKDHVVVAAFSAYGSANQVKLVLEDVNPNSAGFNQAKLVRDASQDLAHDVVTQLLNQYSSTERQLQAEHPIITDVKTYSD